MSEDYSGVKVAIVDLVTARAAKQLSSVDINSDLVAGDGKRVSRRVRMKWRRVTEHGGAGDASVEPWTGGFVASAAPGHLEGFPPYGGATTGRLDTDTVLEGAKRLGAVAGAEVEEVGTRLRRNPAADLGGHCGGGRWRSCWKGKP